VNGTSDVGAPPSNRSECPVSTHVQTRVSANASFSNGLFAGFSGVSGKPARRDRNDRFHLMPFAGGLLAVNRWPGLYGPVENPAGTFGWMLPLAQAA
jgi:hypothetical protein